MLLLSHPLLKSQPALITAGNLADARARSRKARAVQIVALGTEEGDGRGGEGETNSGAVIAKRLHCFRPLRR